MSRDDDWALLCEYTQGDSLRKHMMAVEAAMRAYARKLGEDEEIWGRVGLLHDFDYERWPEEPEHTREGAKILRERHLEDCPRVSVMDKALYACDELCGFLTACALVRPTRLEGLKAKSVRKKLKQASFAAAVNRDDITSGAEDFGVELNEHINFCIEAMQGIAAELELLSEDG